jgi:hypothetical protein
VHDFLKQISQLIKKLQPIRSDRKYQARLFAYRKTGPDAASPTLDIEAYGDIPEQLYLYNIRTIYLCEHHTKRKIAMAIGVVVIRATVINQERSTSVKILDTPICEAKMIKQPPFQLIFVHGYGPYYLPTV